MPAETAPGVPFDNGRFDIVEEPVDSPDPQLRPAALVQISSTIGSRTRAPR